MIEEFLSWAIRVSFSALLPPGFLDHEASLDLGKYARLGYAIGVQRHRVRVLYREGVYWLGF